MTDKHNGLALHDPWRQLKGAKQGTVPSALRGAPVASNVNIAPADRLTAGERLADTVSGWLGSWPFIAVQSLLILLWVALNSVAWREHWDPYPFILLNLAFSFEAAFAAPIIMMSQNRQAAKDRQRAEADYAVNLQAEVDIAAVHTRLEELAGRQWAALLDLQHQQLELLGRIEALTREVSQASSLIGSPPDTE